MLRNRDDSYGSIAILFHWTIAALFFGQMLLGLAPRWVQSMALQFTLIQWHKSFGFLILILAALRLLWAGANRWPRRPPSLGPGEWVAAKSVQGSLYLLMLVLPLTGWALVSTSTLGVPSFAFSLVVVPDLPMLRSEAARGLLAGNASVAGLCHGGDRHRSHDGRAAPSFLAARRHSAAHAQCEGG